MAAANSRIKWFALGTLVVFFILFSAFCMMLILSGSSLRAKKASAGHMVTLDDLAREQVRVPDSQNAAVIYERIAADLSSRATWGDSSLLNDFLQPAERAKNPKLWEQARALVAKREAVIRTAEQAAARPGCLFRVDWRAGYYARYPRTARLIHLCSLLQAKALVDAHDGRMPQAWDTVELLVKVAESLKEDPISTTQTVRQFGIRYASCAVEGCLHYGTIGEEQARRLSALFDGVDPKPGRLRSAEADRALTMWLFREMRKDPRSIKAFLSSTMAPTGAGAILSRAAGYAWGPLSRVDEAACIDFYSKDLAALRLPYREAKAKHLFPPFGSLPSYAIISRAVCMESDGASAQCDAALAEARGASLRLGLAIYKQKRGAYPASLRELEKSLGWKVRQDPFSGKDFVYTRKGKGFLLFSIGPDLKDQGGLAPKHRRDYLRSGDIVWKSDL